MPRCPNGHEQRLGLKCLTCGAELSYRTALNEMRALPKVAPNYGNLAVLAVGYPRLKVLADFVGEVKAGSTEALTPTSFQVAGARGESWLDLYKNDLEGLKKWFKLVGFEKANQRILVVDTTEPVSVLAIAALPKVEHTVAFAIIADGDSTPVQQNTSYVALSLALKRGLPVVAMSETFERSMLYFAEESGFTTGADAVSRLLKSTVTDPDAMMDILERDLKLGIKMHCLSAILAGSKNVYGIATNAYMAQSYNVSMETSPEQYKTVHSVVLARADSQSEFEKSFGTFRNRKFKGALSAEFRFQPTDSDLYDLTTVYGLRTDSALHGLVDGYDAIVKSVPELSVEGVV